MRKILFILLLFCLCFCPQIDIANAEASTTEIYVVTANSASLFQSPDFSSTKLTTFSHNTEVSLEFENSAPQKYSQNSYVFFKVINFDGTDGYIFAELVTPKTDVLTSIPNFNAKTNSICNVFWKQDNEMIDSEITLAKKTEIFLYEGYDRKADWTAIAFVHDNQVLYGYIERKCVDPYGINPLIITCIIVIIAIIGIVFAWVFIKNKKVKLKTKKIKKNDIEN